MKGNGDVILLVSSNTSVFDVPFKSPTFFDVAAMPELPWAESMWNILMRVRWGKISMLSRVLFLLRSCTATSFWKTLNGKRKLGVLYDRNLESSVSFKYHISCQLV
jgi:hypothetical protein